MSLQGIPLDGLHEEDLRRLVSMSVTESVYLEYKRESYRREPSENAEFLKDISSFANTLGGDLVIGIVEKDGVASELSPLAGDCDEEMRRLDDIARSGLQPRLLNLGIRAIPVDSGGRVIVVRVPRSFNPPHRVVARGSNKFWARGGTSNYEPSVEQLRHLFLDAPNISERIRAFQTDRLVKISAGETPIPLHPFGKVVVHVVPVPAFADGRLLDVTSAVRGGSHVPLPLGVKTGYNRSGINLDGYVNYTRSEYTKEIAYAQLFRNGVIEAAGELNHEVDGVTIVTGKRFATLVVDRIKQYLEVLKSYDAGLPVYIFLSLCNASQITYRHSPEGMGWSESGPLGRQIVSLPEVYIESFEADVPGAMQQTFNVLWNGFGHVACDVYDSQGKWQGGA